MFTETNFFYLRVLRHNGLHRVGAVAMGYVADRQVYRVSASICNTAENEFSADTARAKTFGRLRSRQDHVTEYTAEELQNTCLRDVLQYTRTLHLQDDCKAVLGDAKNEETFQRLVKDIIEKTTTSEGA